MTDDEEVHILEKAEVLASEGKYDEAIRLCNSVLEIVTDSAAALNLKGYCIASQGRPAEALPYFKLARLYVPNVATIRFNLALALMQTGDKKAALEEFDEAVNLDHPDARPHRASLRGEMGDETGALADLDEFVLRNPEMPRAYFLRGGWNITRKRFKEALPDLKKALAMDPSLEPELDALMKQMGFKLE